MAYIPQSDKARKRLAEKSGRKEYDAAKKLRTQQEAPQNPFKQEKPGTSVKFNPDNTVDYVDLGGKEYKFTAEEYQNFQRAQSQQSADLRSQKVAEAFDRIPTTKEEQVARYAENFSASAVPSVEEMETRFSVNKAINLANKTGSGLMETPTLVNAAKTGNLPGYAEEGLAGFKESAATILDNVSNLVGMALGRKARKSNTVRSAEEGMATATKSISQNIKLVENGEMSVAEGMKDFDDAIAAINRMESASKTASIANPNYWSDNGMELQTTINNMRKTLALQRQALIDAGEQGRLNRARTAFGYANPAIEGSQSSAVPSYVPSEESE
jgi:hypothetical protein